MTKHLTILTGGSRGMGLAMAQQLLQPGHTLISIARNPNPDWPGWEYIDRGETPPSQMVRDYYRVGWWNPVRGDDIVDQRVAYTLYSFATNRSSRLRPTTAIKLAQLVAGATPDGAMGPKTVAAINAMQPELFVARYALARLARYEQIVRRNRSQGRFLLGWLSRTLQESQI